MKRSPAIHPSPEELAFRDKLIDILQKRPPPHTITVSDACSWGGLTAPPSKTASACIKMFPQHFEYITYQFTPSVRLLAPSAGVTPTVAQQAPMTKPHASRSVSRPLAPFNTNNGQQQVPVPKRQKATLPVRDAEDNPPKDGQNSQPKLSWTSTKIVNTESVLLAKPQEKAPEPVEPSPPLPSTTSRPIPAPVMTRVTKTGPIRTGSGYQPFEFTIVFRNKQKSVLSHRTDTQTFRNLLRSMPPRGVNPSTLQCQTNGYVWSLDAQVITSLKLMPPESRIIDFVEVTRYRR